MVVQILYGRGAHDFGGSSLKILTCDDQFESKERAGNKMDEQKAHPLPTPSRTAITAHLEVDPGLSVV